MEVGKYIIYTRRPWAWLMGDRLISPGCLYKYYHGKQDGQK